MGLLSGFIGRLLIVDVIVSVLFTSGPCLCLKAHPRKDLSIVPFVVIRFKAMIACGFVKKIECKEVSVCPLTI